MDAQNRILPHEFDARLDDAVEFVGHFRITALNGVEVKTRVGFIFTASLGRGSSATHADSVGGTADFHDEHTDVALLLFQVRVIDLTEASGEHDRLDVFTTLTVRHALTERTAEAQNHRLAELVPVIGGAVGGVDENLQRGRQVGRVDRRGVFVRKDLTVQAQVTRHVTGSTGDESGTAARGVRVANAPTGARFRARIRRNARGKVVRLRGEKKIEIGLLLHHCRRPSGVGRSQRRVDETANGGRVVLELDHAVVRAIALDGFLHHLEQRLVDLLPVNGELAGEEPVTGVFRVTLRHVEELDVRRVSTDFVAEQTHVKVEILVIKRQTHLFVNPFERRASFRGDRHRVHLLRRDVGFKRLQRFVVHALRHAIVHHSREHSHSLFVHARPVRRKQLKPPTPFQPRHVLQPARSTHRHRVRRPRALKRQPRSHLHHRRSTLAHQRARRPEQLRFVRLPQQPRQRLLRRVAQPSLALHVEALLRLRARHRVSPQPRVHLPHQRLARLVRHERSPKKVFHVLARRRVPRRASRRLPRASRDDRASPRAHRRRRPSSRARRLRAARRRASRRARRRDRSRRHRAARRRASRRSRVARARVWRRARRRRGGF